MVDTAVLCVHVLTGSCIKHAETVGCGCRVHNDESSSIGCIYHCNVAATGRFDGTTCTVHHFETGPKVTNEAPCVGILVAFLYRLDKITIYFPRKLVAYALAHHVRWEVRVYLGIVPCCGLATGYILEGKGTNGKLNSHCLVACYSAIGNSCCHAIGYCEGSCIECRISLAHCTYYGLSNYLITTVNKAICDFGCCSESRLQCFECLCTCLVNIFNYQLVTGVNRVPVGQCTISPTCGNVDKVGTVHFYKHVTACRCSLHRNIVTGSSCKVQVFAFVVYKLTGTNAIEVHCTLVLGEHKLLSRSILIGTTGCCKVCARSIGIHNTTTGIHGNKCVQACATDLLGRCNNGAFAGSLGQVKTGNSDCSLLTTYLVILNLVAEEITQSVIACGYTTDGIVVVAVRTTGRTIVIVAVNYIATCIQQVNTKYRQFVCATCVQEVNSHIACRWSCYIKCSNFYYTACTIG